MRKQADLNYAMQDEIKEQCEVCREHIRLAEKRLKELQEMCHHERTFEGNWSYRIGVSIPAIICSDCGSLIKYK